MEDDIHPQPPYHSYLLRLWQVGNEEPPGQVWRASLENPHTGEVLNFTSLGRLFEFLVDQCSPETSPEDSPWADGSRRLPTGEIEYQNSFMKGK